MKKLIITLVLLLVLFSSTLMFNKTNIMGWEINPYAIFAGAIGQMIGTYIISILVVFLIQKLQTKDQQRLLIAIFLVLYALLWKINFIKDARHQCRQVVEEIVNNTENNNF